VTRGHKLYFAAVGALALWVGAWCYFNPARSNAAIPWLLPALCSRFLGAMYFSGVTFMVGSMRARRWDEVRVVVPMIAIWTGMLFVVSLFHLGAFDYARPPVWIWFVAYFVYPLVALWLTWTHRGGRGAASAGAPTRTDEGRGTACGDRHPTAADPGRQTTHRIVSTTPAPPDGSGFAGPIAGQAALPAWARTYLLAQGCIATAVALLLLLAPGPAVAIWPWKIGALMAQLYSAPFLSYGIGSLLLARRRTWAEVRVAVTATLVFAGGVLLASSIHRPSFGSPTPADWIWFGGFGLVTMMLALLTALAHANTQSWAVRRQHPHGALGLQQSVTEVV
ncbi:MAG TPA: hypothetical protein VER55_01460, partial [Ardenticatenaceae bacterium]|nr:hypothetical protein [Ardenticatenaceae bacterium]